MKKAPHVFFDEETLRKSTDSEKAFLEAMERKLDDNWFVFHSVRFTDKDAHDIRHEREIDFLLFNPLFGFLAVEVKGRRIVCKDGKYSIDGRPCNPFAQIRQSMYGFANLLRHQLKSGVPFRIAFAVAFPFCRAGDFEMPLRDKEALMDAGKLQNPETWITKRIRDNASVSAEQDATASVSDILRILAPTSEPDDDVGGIETFGIKGIEMRMSTIDRHGSAARAVRARGYLRAHLAHRLDISDVATRLGCSPRLLQISYKAVYGRSMREDLTEIRFGKAKRLLADARIPVSDIAGRCGYDSPAHLMRLFKRRTGMTMLQWRKSKGAAP